MENTRYKWAEVARHYFTKGFPMLYRNHAWPESDPDHISKANDWMGMTLLHRGDFTLTPVLRRGGSITEVEVCKCAELHFGEAQEWGVGEPMRWWKMLMEGPKFLDPLIWHYLTTLRIDFFGLIETGEAVDEDTVKGLPGW